MEIGKPFYEQHWGDGSDDTNRSTRRRMINGKDHLFERVIVSRGHWIVDVSIAQYRYPGAKYVDHYEHRRTLVCCNYFREEENAALAREGKEPLPEY